MKNTASKKLNPFKITKYTVFVLFIIYSALLLFPFLWILMNSFKTAVDFAANVWKIQFSSPQNYLRAFTDFSVNNVNIAMMFGNSIILTALGVVISLITSTCAAYVVAKYDFLGKNFIFATAVILIVVPIVGTLPAQVQLLKNLRMFDTMFGVLFLYSGAFGLNFILLHGYFKNISWAYAEAAFIDGANDFKVLINVIVPISKGAFAAVGVLTFLSFWNDFATPAIFAPSMYTIAVGLDKLSTQLIGANEYPIVFAAIIIAILPVLIIFIIFQKKIIENTIAGGLKG